MSGKRRRGVRIGAYISGMLGNLALTEIDHILTEKYGAKIERNCDDIVILARSREEAKFLLNVLDRLADERGMVVKATARVDKAENGIDFLGYVFTPGNQRLRKSIKQKFARGVARVKSRKRRKEIQDSYKGWCQYGRCRNLWKIMGFADKGIQCGGSRMKDGQKFFDCRQVAITDIINVRMDVLDFEKNIPTRDIRDRSKQNTDRYVVFVRLESGEKVKFITNSFGIKCVLDECDKKQIDFPVTGVTIRRVDCGNGKISYKFQDL